jgi:hypothetical protein
MSTHFYKQKDLDTFVSMLAWLTLKNLTLGYGAMRLTVSQKDKD